MYDLIIIGSGASGLIAAITASRNNLKVLLIEKMNQCGRKLRITGKGRCNLTNTLPLDEFLTHCNNPDNFLLPAFSQFFSKDLISFMEELGVETKVERGSRVFPKSDKALDVFLGMMNEIENSNIDLIKNSRVEKIIIKDKQAKGVKLSNSKEYFADNILLAAGGESYPLTGSQGDGIRLAKDSGHKIIPTIPGLVGLILDFRFTKQETDFGLRNIKAKVLDSKGETLCEELGEMNFASDGVYGPIILSLNRRIARKIHNKEKLTLSIDLKPALSSEKLNNKLISELDQRAYETIASSLRAFLPKNLIDLALDITKISSSKKSSMINPKERESIIRFLKDLRFEIIGDFGYEEAIITIGGVDVKEIDSNTMESKIVKGLYFAGEVMDLDADTGGYNLQIAFSTGYLAAKTISEK